MAKDSHERDQLARRLAAILGKFNQGANVHPKTLAAEFNVTVRTIQRDLLDRLSFLDLHRGEDGSYGIAPEQLGHLSLASLERFTRFLGVREMFPRLNDEALRELLKPDEENALQVHGPQPEDLDDV